MTCRVHKTQVLQFSLMGIPSCPLCRRQVAHEVANAIQQKIATATQEIMPEPREFRV